jgi:hypothetical protein
MQVDGGAEDGDLGHQHSHDDGGEDVHARGSWIGKGEAYRDAGSERATCENDLLRP